MKAYKYDKEMLLNMFTFDTLRESKIPIIVN